MKNSVDFNDSQKILIKICEKFTKTVENNGIFSNLFSKSDKQVAVELIQEFKKCNSVPELIVKLAKYNSYQNVFEPLRDAVVLTIFSTNPIEIEEIGKQIATSDLIQASRGYVSVIGLKVVPNLKAAKNQVFTKYVQDAQSTPILKPIELS